MNKTAKRPLLIALTAVAVVTVGLVTVRAAVAQVYYVPTSIVEPEVPKGARVVVSKLSDPRPGQIVAYRNGEQVWLGRLEPGANGSTVTLSANRHPDRVVPRADVIGPVVLTTR